MGLPWANLKNLNLTHLFRSNLHIFLLLKRPIESIKEYSNKILSNLNLKKSFTVCGTQTFICYKLKVAELISNFPAS